MYAIVRAGGRQEKVAVGDVLVVDRVKAAPGSMLKLPALLLVDGESVISDSASLARISVDARVLGEDKGPKIHILKYKNKTGYRKRMGYRSKLTRIKVTQIDAGTGASTTEGTTSDSAAQPAPLG